MEQNLFIACVVIIITGIAITYAKMVLIWHDVERKKLKRMINEWDELNVQQREQLLKEQRIGL